jgi:hypothetical protein
MDPESVNQSDRRGARAMELAARPPAGFTSLPGLQKSKEQKNRNQKEKPFTQISLQNLKEPLKSYGPGQN